MMVVIVVRDVVAEMAGHRCGSVVENRSVIGSPEDHSASSKVPHGTKFMGDEKNRASLFVQMAECFGECALTFCVNPGGWFVEDESIGVGRECSRDHGSPLLATGEAVEAVAIALGKSDRGQRLPGAGGSEPVGAKSVAWPDAGRSHNFAYRNGNVSGRQQPLRNIGNALPVTESIERLAVKPQ